jgi:TonB-dependent receptor
VAGYRNVVDWKYTGSGVPSVTAIGIPEIGVLGGTFTDPTFSNAHFMMYESGGEREETINEAKFDGELNFGDHLLSRMNFGVYMSKKDNDSSSNGMIDLFRYNGYWQPLDPSVLRVYDAGSDFLGGDGNAPTAWLTFEPLDLLYYLRDVSGNPDLLTPGAGGGPGGPPGPGGSSGGAWEKGAAFYLQADLEGEIASKLWKVNVGVRYNRTEIGQPGFSSSNLIDLLPVPGDPTMYETVYDDTETVEITEGGTFTNWLPTLNARMNWTDEIVFRVSASQSLTDPNLGDMSPGMRWGMPRPNNLTASAGNPDLEPYLSTNIDVSGEWYYNRGGYVSATLFSKRVDNYIVSGYATEYIPMGNSSGDFPDGVAEVRVSRPRNLEVAKVKGLELSFSHNFFYLRAPWDGFGFAVNATFVDCPDTLAPGEIDTERAFALEGVGNSQNLMVYYERGPFGIRASYNNREDYLQRTFNGEGNEPLFAKGSGQLDIRASYAINDHFSVTFDGTNVTHTDQETYGRYENQWISLVDTGYRYTLGIRAAF